MTITLSDIAGATSTYLHDEVEVRVTDVTANLNPGESGDFTVKIRNAAAPTGVRLRDVTIHLTSSDEDVAQLKVQNSVFFEYRATGDDDDPLLAVNALVGEMYVFFKQDIEPNGTWDVGEERDFDFPYRAAGPGRAQFTAHIHATIDPDDLLPRTRSGDVSRDVVVRPA